MFLRDCPFPLGEILRESFPFGRGRGIQPANGIPILRVTFENGQHDEGHCAVFFPIGTVGGEVLGVFTVISRHPGADDLKIIFPVPLNLIGVITQ